MCTYSIFKSYSVRDVARNFKRGGHIFHIFQAYFFGRINLKLLEKQEKLSEGPGASPRKKFGNLHAAYNAYFSAF